jgi:hypothetical protein
MHQDPQKWKKLRFVSTSQWLYRNMSLSFLLFLPQHLFHVTNAASLCHSSLSSYGYDFTRTVDKVLRLRVKFLSNEVTNGDWLHKVKDSLQIQASILHLFTVIGHTCVRNIVFFWVLFSLHNMPWDFCRENWVVNSIYNSFNYSWILLQNITEIWAKYLQITPTLGISTAMTQLSFCLLSRSPVKGSFTKLRSLEDAELSYLPGLSLIHTIHQLIETELMRPMSHKHLVWWGLFNLLWLWPLSCEMFLNARVSVHAFRCLSNSLKPNFYQVPPLSSPQGFWCSKAVKYFSRLGSEAWPRVFHVILGQGAGTASQS